MTFDWHAVVGVLSGVVQIGSVIPYIRDMLKGTTRPNIVSWSLWTLLQVIAIGAQISAGASWSLLFIVAMTFNTILVVILSATGYGYKGYSWVDWTCLFFAIAAIVLWWATRNSIFALVLAVSADLLASIPTIVKTYKEPQSETAVAWYLVTVASALGILSTTKIDIANLIYPIYFFIITGSIGSLAFFGQRFQKN
ncbi:MAG: hypothetical protein KGH79_00275 [Patescibacteria group bacterium]|nr:hypothetical protein [Patescibacteria group bacterium]